MSLFNKNIKSVVDTIIDKLGLQYVDFIILKEYNMIQGGNMNNASKELLDLLKQVRAEKQYIFIDKQLSRKEYLILSSLFKNYGGKWNKSRFGFEFKKEIEDDMQLIISTGLMQKKNPLAYFPTPKSIVYDMLNFADMIWDSKIIPCEAANINILEPSAGEGAIVDEISHAFPSAKIQTVEVMKENQDILEHKGYLVHRGDFLEFKPKNNLLYDYIFINPPFSYDRHKYAYIEHIEHAISMLSNTGYLIGIAPSSFIYGKTKREKNFYNLISSCFNMELIPKGAFKESGTNVETVIFKLNKATSTHSNKPHNGYSSYLSYMFFLSLDNDSRFSENLYNLLESKEVDFFDEDKIIDLMNLAIDTFVNESIYFPFSELNNFIHDAYKRYNFANNHDSINKNKVILRPTLFEDLAI